MEIFDAAPANETWFELWKCKSFPELRLKAAVLGVDVDEWLTRAGVLWLPRDDGGQVLWYDRDEIAEAQL